jgi:hypothetical protein
MDILHSRVSQKRLGKSVSEKYLPPVRCACGVQPLYPSNLVGAILREKVHSRAYQPPGIASLHSANAELEKPSVKSRRGTVGLVHNGATHSTDLLRNILFEDLNNLCNVILFKNYVVIEKENQVSLRPFCPLIPLDGRASDSGTEIE